MNNEEKIKLISYAANAINFLYASSSIEEKFVETIKFCRSSSPEDFPIPHDQQGNPLNIEKEEAKKIAFYLLTADDDSKPSDEELCRRAIPLIKAYPQYFGDMIPQHAAESEKIAKINLKEITVSGSCSLCGLCDQEELSDVFTYDENGKLTVQQGGVIDVEKYPKVLEVAEMCPEKAIQISEVKELSQEDINKVVEQFNCLVNNELRDYPFKVPTYYDYEYKSKTFEALPVPARYQSEKKYLIDDMAENAGLSEFTKAVYSQVESIAKQFVAAYKIKNLQQFYVYEEAPDNFYHQTNLKISRLLEKAYQMARVISNYQLPVPPSFCEFHVKADWECCGYSSEKLQKLEEIDFNLSRSRWFRDAEHYRTYISIRDSGGKYVYDFSEAERQLREDIDYALEDIMEEYVAESVSLLVNDYVKKARAVLAQKVALLQAEVKKLSRVTSNEEFSIRIMDFCNTILKAELPSMLSPYMEDFDDKYNDAPRFSSLRACEKAAENRRERVHREGFHFLEKIHCHLEEKWLEALCKTLTEWKRQLLGIYDFCGRPYSIQPINVRIGEKELAIFLSDHKDVMVERDYSIYNYADSYIRLSACYGDINGVSYVSEYKCEITTDYDCDFKETLFGDIKEVNKRYRYFLSSLYTFKISADNVASEATKVLRDSDFMKNHFSGIKKSFVSEIHRITGV